MNDLSGRTNHLSITFANRKNDAGEPLAISQEAIGWYTENGVFGAFIDENSLVLIPLEQIESVLIQYPEVEEDDVDPSKETTEGDAESAPDAGEAKVYVPNFGGGGSESD